jgi:hypothetical protein
MFERIAFIGQSGKEYRYWIYDLGDKFGSTPANYAFVREAEPDWFEPIYIGQTKDIHREVFANLPNWQCIQQNHPTRLCVHRSSKHESKRIAEMNDLINRYHPPCNG